MASQKHCSFKVQQLGVGLFAERLPVFRLVELFLKVDDGDVLILAEKFTAFRDRWHRRRARPLLPIAGAAVHALEPRPLRHDDILPCDPFEIVIAVLADNRLYLGSVHLGRLPLAVVHFSAITVQEPTTL